MAAETAEKLYNLITLISKGERSWGFGRVYGRRALCSMGEEDDERELRHRQPMIDKVLSTSAARTQITESSLNEVARPGGSVLHIPCRHVTNAWVSPFSKNEDRTALGGPRTIISAYEGSSSSSSVHVDNYGRLVPACGSPSKLEWDPRIGQLDMTFIVMGLMSFLGSVVDVEFHLKGCMPLGSLHACRMMRREKYDTDWIEYDKMVI
ncbi:hypothetical protein B0H34DRAFT_677108 [Crassisporium funariophilum]|nr:hypothetical protein B0H34DRAFT_677108 [Crassisporium funariophilum]